LLLDGEFIFRGCARHQVVMLSIVPPSVFDLSSGLSANVNKKAAWSVHKYDFVVDVIFQLLLVKHRYANLLMFSSDEVDFMIVFMY